MQDSAGRIWIGTFGGGLNLIEHLPESAGLRFHSLRKYSQ
ncbi:MAG: hypothetical protein ACLUE2_09110 [Bacteroides cellulosilyticus]